MIDICIHPPTFTSHSWVVSVLRPRNKTAELSLKVRALFWATHTLKTYFIHIYIYIFRILNIKWSTSRSDDEVKLMEVIKLLSRVWRRRGGGVFKLQYFLYTHSSLRPVRLYLVCRHNSELLLGSILAYSYSLSGSDLPPCPLCWASGLKFLSLHSDWSVKFSWGGISSELRTSTLTSAPASECRSCILLSYASG